MCWFFIKKPAVTIEPIQSSLPLSCAQPINLITVLLPVMGQPDTRIVN